MATATPPVSKNAVYPRDELAKLLAPPEQEHPGAKLRRLLHEARDKGSYLHTAGAYDAYTAAIMTRLGFKALYGSGWQLAATKNMYPDIGVYHSHQMVELVLEMWKGIEGARHTHYYDTEGKELLSMPADVRGHGGRLRRPDPDLHPGHRADPGPGRPACTSRTRIPPTAPAATS